MSERCGKWMPRAQAHCVRRLGHPNNCCSAKSLAWATEYRAKNKERRAAGNKAWREANRGRRSAQKKAYHAANRERILARMKEYQKSEGGLETRRRYTEMGYAAETSSRYARRKADERDNTRLEALLGGHQSATTEPRYSGR